MNDDRIFTAEEAADLLGVSMNQLYKLVTSRKIHPVKTEEQVGFRWSDLFPPK